MLESGQLAPDLAIVDLQMPTMDGLDFLSECTARGLAHIPMVVLTSSSARQDAVRSRVRGALQVVTKPENVDQLRHALREVIDTFVPSAPSSPEDNAPVWSLASRQNVAAPAVVAATSAGSAKSFGRRDTRVRS